MKRVVGGLFVFSGIFWASLGQAQGASSPPTAQFPPADPSSAAPATLPAAAPPPAAPAPAAPPPPPPGTVPPPLPGAYPAYPPPPPGYAAPAAPSAAAADSNEVFSLTMAPLLLISPILELTGEVRVTPHMGAALIAGYGQLSVDTNQVDGNGFGTQNAVKLSAYELGGQLVGYPLKKFKSLQLGAQLLYLKVETVQGASLSGQAAGVAIGPFVGYKLLTAVGFTFLAQGGFEYLAAKAETDSDSAQESTFVPLLRLNVGWSF